MNDATPAGPPLTRFGRRQVKGLLLGYSAPVVVTVGAGLVILAIALLVSSAIGAVVTSPL